MALALALAILGKECKKVERVKKVKRVESLQLLVKGRGIKKERATLLDCPLKYLIVLITIQV